MHVFGLLTSVLLSTFLLADPPADPPLPEVPAGVVLEETRYPDGSLKTRQETRRSRAGAMEVRGRRWQYDPSGRLVTLSTWDGPFRDGPWIEYARDGRVTLQGSYKRGARDGTFVHYDREGTKQREVTFRNDRREGLLREWAAGTVVLEETYAGGRLEGVRREEGHPGRGRRG